MPSRSGRTVSPKTPKPLVDNQRPQVSFCSRLFSPRSRSSPNEGAYSPTFPQFQLSSPSAKPTRDWIYGNTSCWSENMTALATAHLPNAASPTAAPLTAVHLRRGHSNYHRPPTVRSLVLSEIFLPLENSNGYSGRSRSACRSCFIEKSSSYPEAVQTPPESNKKPPLPPPSLLRGKKKTSFQRSDSILSKLQSLFHIKKPSPAPPPLSDKLPPPAPKIHPPLMRFGSSASQLRGRSQSTASRTRRNCPSPLPSAQSSPAHSLDYEPLVCALESSNRQLWMSSCGSRAADARLVSFSKSPATLSRPRDLPLVQRHQRSCVTTAVEDNGRGRAESHINARHKHLSAHVLGEVLQEVLPSRISSGLWSASSVTSLGAPTFRVPLGASTDVPDASPARCLPKTKLRHQQHWQLPEPPLPPPPAKSVSSFSSSYAFSTYPRRPSASYSNDSAVELLPCGSSENSNGTDSLRRGGGRLYDGQSEHYATVYSSPQSRIYEDVDDGDDLDTPIGHSSLDVNQSSFSEKTPTASTSRRPSTTTTKTNHQQNEGLSVSTVTLTSGESELDVTEPTYAVPMPLRQNQTTGPQPAPPVPPRGPQATSDVERHIDPPSVMDVPPPPIFTNENQATPQRRATSVLRGIGDCAGYGRSPIFSENGQSYYPRGQPRPTSTISIRSTAVTSAASRGSWYADILPYRPSTLPENLADRLKQRSSLALSTSTPSYCGSSSTSTATTQNQPESFESSSLMTRSLFESRSFVVSKVAAVLPTTTLRRSSRSTSRTRPVSLHVSACTTFLPSLDHLMPRRMPPTQTMQQQQHPPPASLGKSPPQPLAFQHPPSDSPLLGQYCRLKLVIPRAQTTVSTAEGLQNGNGEEDGVADDSYHSVTFV